MNSVWCPPAAATSKACRATGWPCTSARSGGGRRMASTRSTPSWSGHGASPHSASTSSPRFATRRTRPKATTWASVALAIGTTTSRSPTAPTIGATPLTGRSDPSRPSSPMNAIPSIASAGMTSLAASTPTAMAKSSPEPALRSPDGARLTVIRCFGQGSPLLSTAARARSLDSRIDVSGRPTRLNPGSPPDTWTSTWIRCPSAQKSTADGTDANMRTSSDDAVTRGNIEEGRGAPRPRPDLRLGRAVHSTQGLSHSPAHPPLR